MKGSRFLFLDGNPGWLDFVNTLLVVDGNFTDLLRGFDDVAAWLRDSGLLEPARCDAAIRKWADSGQGRQTLRRAVEFRRTLHAVADRLWNGQPFPASTVKAVNRMLSLGSGFYRLVPEKAGFRLTFLSMPRKARQLLEPLARSAAEFLTRADLGRVRKCSNPKCVLFFYDTTRNRTRRWCSMSGCGNRMKAASHYERIRKQRKGSGTS